MVGIISERLALCYGFSEELAGQIRTAAALHDIGKAKIDKSILDKPGKLTDKEFNIMKLHTIYGYELMEALTGAHADMARKIALYHHERYDGRGYWNVENNKQPIYVKIAAIADVYTALVSIRPYKDAWTGGEAVEYIRSHAGSQFDPELVKLFIPLARHSNFHLETGR